MRARNILIIIAVILVLLNGFAYLNGAPRMPEGDIIDKIAFLTGYNFLVVISFILLIVAYFVHRRAKRRRRKKMIESLLEK